MLYYLSDSYIYAVSRVHPLINSTFDSWQHLISPEELLHYELMRDFTVPGRQRRVIASVD